MKNKIVTLSFREIKKNLKRFLYLSVLSFLGVAVFVGIMAAEPDMMKTLDVYYDMNNVYDLKLISTLGLTHEDINVINQLDDRFNTYGIHSKDAIFKQGDSSLQVLKIIELDNEHNNIKLVEGRLPEKNDEIAIEKAAFNKTKIKIGDTIKLELKDNDETVSNTELKVVGAVISPIYLTNGNGGISRGNTTIGNGKIDFYSFTTKDFFNMDYYTEICINVVNNYETDSKEYNELISYATDRIKEIKEEREKERYNQIIESANNEIDIKEKQALTEFDEAKIQLDSANRQLTTALNMLNSSNDQLKILKDELDNGLIKINEGNAKIEETERKLNSGKIELDNAVNTINLKMSVYDLDYEDLLVIKKAIDGKSLTKEEIISIIPKEIKYYDSIIKIINYIYDNEYNYLFSNIVNGLEREKIIMVIPKNIDNYEEVCNYINTVTDEQIKRAVINYLLDSKNAEKIKQRIPSNIIGFKYLIQAIEKYQITVNEIVELFDNVEKIRNGYIEYNNGKEILEAGKIELSKGYNEYLKQLDEYNKAVKLLKSKRTEYNSNYQLYKNNLEEYNARKFDIESNIAKARQDVKNIELANWIIYNRKDNPDYLSFLNCAQSIKKLAVLFPVVFYVVAVFISLLSMSRMAFEDRSEIGTLKSLGFSNMQIRFKYIIYSLIATLLGGILGSLLGFYLIAWIIFDTYKMLFEIPIFIYKANIIPILLGITISIICICGTTIITINNLIKEKTTELMRPKIPIHGKTIMLEHIKFIWNKFSFSNKILLRNIFRYKKRISMTILGIAGCTLLLLSGYAIKDSIVNIANIQYTDIFKYDDAVYTNDKLSKNQIVELFSNEHIEHKAYTKTMVVRTEDKDITLIVPDDEQTFNQLFVLKDIDTQSKLELENNKVIITSKLAKLLKLKINDILIVKDINDKTCSFEISGISQNYIGYFMYMNKTTYESNFGEYKINLTYLKVDDEKNENNLKTKLLENSEIYGVVSIQESLENIKGLFDSLDTIVIILVIFSGMLAFVVLYNLSYINISERQREIATLKVLGFNNKENDKYIISEQIIITLIGIIVGLFVGTWFGMIIVETIEIDMAEFIKDITPLSYLKTFIFMSIFSLIVNIKVHFILKKIDMIESLKSIE